MRGTPRGGLSKVEGNEGLRARLTADRGRGEGGLHLDEFVFADTEAKGMVRGAR